MNPSYKTQIDICLVTPVEANSIWFNRMCYLPFAPREGDTIRITSEDEEQTLDLTFEGVYYDMSAGMFVCDIQDSSLCETYSETGACNTNASGASYVSFGFSRMNFPTAQVLHTQN